MRRSLVILSFLILLVACSKRARPTVISTTTGGGRPAEVVDLRDIPKNELDGIASWYGEPYHGRRASNGEIYDMNKMTAAHRMLPFETMVRVHNERNGKEVDVRITDRGPFVDGRVIDLSYAAAKEIEMVGPGTAPVKIKVLRIGGGVPAGSVYSVQVAAFENRRSAEDLRERLSRKYPAVSVQTYSGNRTIYRVWVGREPALKQAERLASELRKDDFRPFVVRVN